MASPLSAFARSPKYPFICDVCGQPGLGNIGQKRHSGRCRRDHLNKIRQAAKKENRGLCLRLDFKDGTNAYGWVYNDLLGLDFNRGVEVRLTTGKSAQYCKEQLSRVSIMQVIGAKRLRREKRT